MILLMNKKSSQDVLHYHSFTLDDSINEYEITTRCISLLIIHTGADDSINESEINTKCISLLIIHTAADGSINDMKSSRNVYHLTFFAKTTASKDESTCWSLSKLPVACQNYHSLTSKKVRSVTGQGAVCDY